MNNYCPFYHAFTDYQGLGDIVPCHSGLDIRVCGGKHIHGIQYDWTKYAY